MGGGSVAAGISILNRANIPTFPYPDLAVRMFNYMWKYQRNLQALYETPELSDQAERNPPDTVRARAILEAVRAEGRTLLTEYESKQLLTSYGIPTVATHRAATPAEARAAADQLGYPVVIKIDSTTITHKTDVGGVRLNLQSGDEVEQAFTEMKTRVLQTFKESDFLGVTVQPMIKLEGYEVIVGSSLDAQFGPVLLFGTGGQLVEVFKDRAVALPPLNSTLARRMMEKTKIYKALKGVRGRAPANLRLVEDVMVRFSQLVSENRLIAECDINPLLVGSGDNIVALDARVVLHAPSIPEAELPRTVVRPYPNQYVKDLELRGGTKVQIRPIRPEDEGMMVEFHQTLSERSVTFRFFRATSLGERVDHERLTRICFIDYSREMALVATTQSPSGHKVVAGVIRMIRDRATPSARFVMIVSDDLQKRGIGTALLQELLNVAKAEGITHLQAAMLTENTDMLALCRRFGFSLVSEQGSPTYAELTLS